MTGIGVSLLLVGTLIFVHFSSKRNPIDPTRPLEGDQPLPWPWAGYASSIFSLTALFGGYIGVLVVIGPSALLGLGLGSVLALYYLRGNLEAHPTATFEAFLSERSPAKSHGTRSVIWILLTATQMVLAISEIVLLRQIAIQAFVIDPRFASGLALSLALVGYLYCLLGGYVAVYETDILQLGLVVAMAVAIATAIVINDQGIQSANVFTNPLDSDYWMRNFEAGGPLGYVFNLAVSAIAGSSLVLATPDIWKRLFISVKRDSAAKSRRSFHLLLGAGFAPFILLIPTLLLLPRPNLDDPMPFSAFSSLLESPMLLLAVTLGLMASFLSTFDSAMISAVHLALVRQGDSESKHRPRIAQYHYTGGIIFIAVIAGALTSIGSVGNPFFPGLLLLGFYAILGGVIVGSGLLQRSMRFEVLGWVVGLGLVLWFLLVVRIDGVTTQPIPEQLHLVPMAAAVFILMAIISRIATVSAPEKRP